MDMFKGVVNNRDLSNWKNKDRYGMVAWTSAWGCYGIKSIFDTIDNLNPGDEIDYKTWQKLIYANKILAKWNGDWFDWQQFYDKGVFPTWDDRTESYKYLDINGNEVGIKPDDEEMERVRAEAKNRYPDSKESQNAYIQGYINCYKKRPRDL